MSAVSDEAGVVDAVRAARNDKAGLEIVGRGTKRRLGRQVSTNRILDVSGLSGIVKHEPEELILSVKPATPIAEIEAVLAARKQRLGFEPADWSGLLGSEAGLHSIGGAISADTNGSARVRAGAVRDHLLGLHGVNGLGEAFRGGSRVVKNVTGFDVPKLVCGAMGTLTVLTEVTLRVFPKPTRLTVLKAEGVGIEDGFAALRKVWTSPLEATGLAFVPSPSSDAILIRLEGEAAPLAEKISALRALLARYDLKEVEDGEARFKAIASGAVLPKDAKTIWRVILPPGSAASFVKTLQTSQWVADWAGGLFWIAADRTDANLRDSVSKLGGHAILVRGEGDAFPPLSPVVAKMNMSVKQAFDPERVLNPGRLYEDL